MNLSDGIREYVTRKHENGFAFENGEQFLVRIYRTLGDLPLKDVNAQQVTNCLNGTSISNVTWRLRYHVVVRFLQYWEYRGLMPKVVLPDPRPAITQEFVPYIYSRTELRTIFRCAGRSWPSILKTSPQTMRTALMLLYATGALMNEGIALRISDIDFKRSLITIGRRPRRIPFGIDLRDVLMRYMGWRKRNRFACPLLFVVKGDCPLSGDRFRKDFRKICYMSRVRRNDGARYRPRLQDLRFTFAVHRITTWIRNGSDLNRMLPALAAYMGQVGLGATERYLSMTPERFRKSLSILSPVRMKRHWRDDRNLMEFLVSLEQSRSLASGSFGTAT